MCGSILLGALGLFLAAKLIGCAVRGHHYRRHAYAYGGCGRGWHGSEHGESRHEGRGGFGRGFGRGGFGGAFRNGMGRRWALRWLSERLDATPGQEKVIAEAFDTIKNALKDAKGSFAKSRSTIAGAVRGDEFGHDSIGEAWVSHDDALEKVRLEIVRELQKVHEALDERQRKIFADLIEKGPGFRSFTGEDDDDDGRRDGATET